MKIIIIWINEIFLKNSVVVVFFKFPIIKQIPKYISKKYLGSNWPVIKINKKETINKINTDGLKRAK